MKLVLAFLIVAKFSVVLSLPSHSKSRGSAMDDILAVNGDDKRLLFGDEMLTEAERKELFPEGYKHGRVKRGLTKRSRGFRWPNKVFPYTLSDSFSESEKKTIRSAVNKIGTVTCIRFIEHVVGRAPTAHVAMFPGTGCWSYVGRLGNEQQLSLQSRGCVSPGTVMHEVLHALGVYHEQSRADRDDFVTINYHNVLAGLENNFNKQDTDSLGVPYDPNSVMHYGNKDFSKNDQPTIAWKKNPFLQLGGRDLTTKDIEQLNLFYECSNPTPSTTRSTRPTTTTTTTRPTTTTTTTRPTTTTTTTRPTTTTTTTRPTTTTTTTRSTTTTTTTRPTTTTTTTRPTTTTTTTRPATTTTTTKPTTTTTTTRPTTTTTTTRPTTTTTTTKPTTTTTTTRPTTTTTTTKPTTTTTTTRPTTSTTTTKPTTTSSTRKPGTTSTPTLTDPPTGACGDSSYYCIVVQFQNDTLCPNYKYICPRTCGECTGPENETCVNLNDSGSRTTCKKLAARGDCQHKNRWYRFSMKRKCARTCCDRTELYKLPSK